MRVSLNHIKQYLKDDIPSTVELVEKINRQLGAVEEVTEFGKRYDGATIVRVSSCKKHPNADKLSLCEIDDGSGQTIQVVCGAPNVHEGMFAVWLKPGMVVPSTFDDKEPFLLEARELRGVVSNGMLASAKELGFGDSHDGILEIDAKEWKPNELPIEPGASFAEVYGLNDQIIDIENKMFTHRPDLFGQIGVAREIAGIQNQIFKSPDWYVQHPSSAPSDNALELTVESEAEGVKRFVVAVLKDVSVKASPLWLQAELVRLGSKPINNIVDVTNYVMLLTAQPTHAYDYDKLRGKKLGTRNARKSESVTLLNGKSYQLDTSDIVIVDGEGPVGIGGIMGGNDSEVSLGTKNIVLEVATFDMYAVRKSSMRHGLFTDALTRFNKGQSPLQNAHVMQLLISSIQDVAGGFLCGEVRDTRPEPTHHADAFVEPEFVNERLGLELSRQQMEQLLRNVEFEICSGCDDKRCAKNIHYTPPFWRTDIEIAEDIVEEIGRLYGFDKLPRELPQRSIAPAKPNQQLALKQQVRDRLSRAGANEVLTYSFVHQKLIKRAGQDEKHAFKLLNALSPDLQYYRLSLTPSLLEKVHLNIKSGEHTFALFELGKSHLKGEMDSDQAEVPNEDSLLALVVAYSDKLAPKGAPYYHAKRYFSEIVSSDDEIVPLSDAEVENDIKGAQLCAPYDPSRSAVLRKNGQVYGVVGEFKAEVKKAFKLPKYSAGFEVRADYLSLPTITYTPLSRFPSVFQDLTLKVPSKILFSELFSQIHQVVEKNDDIQIVVSPLGVFKNTDNELSYSFRITATSHTETLTDEKVRAVVEEIIKTTSKTLDAKEA